MAGLGFKYWRFRFALGMANRAAMGIGLAISISGSLRAEPLDACALAPVNAAEPPLAVQTVTIARSTGPNSFLTTDGREVRLASVSTPHRFPLGPSTAAETAAVDTQTADEDEDARPIVDAGDPSGAIVDARAAARSAVDAWLVGQSVTLYPVTPKPDRYGRLRARAVRVSDGLWIEAELVAGGLARVEPQTDDFGCARHLEAVEAKSRDAKLGLWALPEFAVVEADDVTRDRWTGRYVLIEGKIVSFRSSGTRRYLNFGRNFSRDFAVVLVDKGATGARATAKQSPSRFQQEGFDAQTVVGRRVRVRGVLGLGGGGLMFPSVPEEIEWVQGQP